MLGAGPRDYRRAQDGKTSRLSRAGLGLDRICPVPENKIPDDVKSPSAGLSPLDGAEPQVRFEHP
jgi:hypothetical protein